MKKAKKPKKHRKFIRTLAQNVTLRFMQVMNEIIATNRRTGGKYRNQKTFAKGIESNASVINNYKKLERNVTLEMVCQLYKVHHVNMNWLIGGTGERFAKPAASITDLERKMGEMEAV